MKALVVTIRAKPEHRQAVLEELVRDAVASEAREPGCLVFNVTRDSRDPDVMHLFEVYRDMDAPDIHRQTPHIQRFREATAGACGGHRRGGVRDRLPAS